MYGCESWTIKKAECFRIDAFKLRCWRRLLRVPWTARRSSQSILKGISLGCSLEGLILKLKLQYFGHLMRRADSFEKTGCWARLKAGGEGDDGGWDGKMASPTQWAWVWISSRSWWWTGRSSLLWFMGSQRVRHDWATELNVCIYYFVCVCVCIATLKLFAYLFLRAFFDVPSWITTVSLIHISYSFHMYNRGIFVITSCYFHDWTFTLKHFLICKL